jgi:alpha-tubulin suppressor-like RCC1 family protein
VALTLAIFGLLGGAQASAASVIEVSAGEFHTCALLAGGAVDCWGDGEFGQLGDAANSSSPTPVSVSGLPAATQVSAGGDHTCALLTGGTVECWGKGDAGQLGNGASTDSPTPVPVSGLAGVSAISAGLEHTCALLAGGTVECWGANGSGRLGDGTTVNRSTPVAVAGLAEVTAIAAGWEHTCAIHGVAGAVSCWGANDGFQLGDGTTEERLTPVTVVGVTGAEGVGAGDLYTCALLLAEEVECWGQLNPEGEGTGPGPTAIPLGSTPTALAVGGFHACALSAGGGECWGDGGNGQLGDGKQTDSLVVPVAVSLPAGATDVTAGAFHSCAVAAGGVECWGDNEFGQLGDGTTQLALAPVAVDFTPRGGEKSPETGPPSTATTEGTGQQQRGTGGEGGAPTPVFGKTVSVVPVAGQVRVKLPGRQAFVALAAAGNVPLGTVVDTTAGTVELLAAGGPTEAEQSGRFDGGVFRVTQKLAHSPFHPGKVGLTVLALVGPPPSCAAPRHAAARASGGRRGGNHLWGDAHGNFQTGGRFAAVTVGGTKWLTAETCAGTLVKVARGVVSVLDKVRKRTVKVPAPHGYLARPAGA